MPLTLRITSTAKDILGPDSTRVFGVHGGSIGRAPDNEWALPDPRHYLSTHHAIIDYQGGAYYLTDTSTNGVFVNDSDQPVGRGAPLRLFDGDRLAMGDYRFGVNIVNVSGEGASDTGIFIADDAADDEDETSSQDASPDPEEDRLSAGEDDPTVPSVGDVTTTQPIVVEKPDDKPDSDPDSTADNNEDTQPVAQLGGTIARDALDIVFEAAGVNIEKVPEGDEEQFLDTIGHFVRAATQGLLDVLRTRSRFKDQLGLAKTGIRAKENNPLKFAADVDQALDELMIYQGIHHLPAVDAVEEAFVDVRAHEKALSVAMRAAFFDLLKRFDPSALEKDFNSGLRPGALLGIKNKSKYWDLYADFYASVAGSSEKKFDELVRRRFTEAYDAEIRRSQGDGNSTRKDAD
jgi:type VI secretion system protein ImpI